MTATVANSSVAGHGVAVAFEDLHRWYGSVHALDGLTIDIAPGELIALLGPSGCGKTTALRALGGLDEADAGRILVDGADITHVPTNKRNMGIVFQAYSLFPNMTARDNVGYGLRLRGVDPAARKRRADEALDLVGLQPQAGRYPHQMSGGQQQRVALARALAIEPKVLLLDEPLSALDAKVRRQLREEIRRIQLMLGITTLFVTHDQEEALAMGDRVGVMSAGRLEQIAAPAELYDRPKTRFVAEFVGLTNRMPGTADGDRVVVGGTSVPLLPGSAGRGPVIALVRPENIRLTALTDGAAASAGPGTARVVATSFLGSLGRTQVVLPDGSLVVAQTAASDSSILVPDTAVRLEVAPNPVFTVEPEPASSSAATAVA
ncbi:MAG: ABC transporter ATP-binding protein [Chloroflexi bacterium]|nr:ABC transporter ATP-binding protein [Chloroflexota bacterium]